MRGLNRWWVRMMLAMLLAWVGVLVTVWLWARIGYPGVVGHAAESELCDVPPERVLRVPFGAWYTPDDSLNSPVPIVRLREKNHAEYELLYWGNPVRPRYAYRVLNIMNGQTLLRDAAGKPVSSRELPVPRPQRADTRLPLQPVLELGRLPASPGGFVAARVEVIDATRGVVLCGAEFLLACDASKTLKIEKYE